MRKQIDIPDEYVKTLKKLAVDAGLNFKAFLESHIIEIAKTKRRDGR